MMDSPVAIEMKTIRTNVLPSSHILFKIVRDTRCIIRKSNDRMRYTSIILRPNEVYYGAIVLHKNHAYIDISECYREGHTFDGNARTLDLGTSIGVIADNVLSKDNIYIPIIFDMSGKYIVNIVEYKTLL